MYKRRKDHIEDGDKHVYFVNSYLDTAESEERLWSGNKIHTSACLPPFLHRYQTATRGPAGLAQGVMVAIAVPVMFDGSHPMVGKLER